MQKPDDRPIAISMGDPAGIGPEILLKALCSPDRQAIAAIVFGDPGWLMRQARSLGLERRLALKTTTRFNGSSPVRCLRILRWLVQAQRVGNALSPRSLQQPIR
ncbi:MAG: hypothetical protein EBS52_05505 [Betaproteobacteria bacterium]|nr:hypothetical protein [Betaproteobacteria bacterium]